MNDNLPRALSVVEPVGPAIERVKTVLFRPFNAGKWLIIGFTAWLAYLLDGGGSGGSFGGGPGEGGPNSREDLKEFFYQAKEWVAANLYWIIPVTLTIVLVVTIIWVVLLWLSSRGKFMFVHCVATNKAEVAIPWSRYAGQAHSLFLFRLVLGLLGFFSGLLILGISGFVIAGAYGSSAFTVTLIITIAVCVLLLICSGIVFGVISKFTEDLVIPIMYKRMTTSRAAWSELLAIMSGRKTVFFLYILFQIAIAFAIGAMIFVAVCATCCILACPLSIPYFGTVFLLPLLVFKRAYPLYFLQQLGPDYDCIVPEPVPAVPTVSPSTDYYQPDQTPDSERET